MFDIVITSMSKNQDNQNLIEKITNISKFKGMAASSMITLAIPPKYCF